MSHDHARGTSVLIHSSRLYDLSFGWLIRRGDAELLARAGVAPGDRVLDVGTGPGYLALAASRLVGADGAAAGIDAAPEMIERARLLAARRGSKAEYLVASAERLPFDDHTFDVVVSRLVLHHLPYDVKLRALREMARVLRPGGRLLLADLASKTVQRRHHRAAHPVGAGRDDRVFLESLVAEAGFTQITCGRLMRGFLAGVSARTPARAGEG